ncbi:hypothetical protein HOLleu_38640 [Holothuria leucospilota]|uniref:Uncharacterized protein n=1 Tax=Holothuria leucospilota TaxID=206669 RepID=A0A9Q1BDI2_HOLLE|nr:hypothetical protein HOLleu_38640 [Holothuria leucospilota]
MYVSKAERDIGILLKNVSQEAHGGNLDVMRELRKLVSVHLNLREVSVMETV